MPTTTEFEPRFGPTLWVQTECANCDCPPSRVAWVATPCPEYIIGTVFDMRSGEPLESIYVWTESFETGSFAEAVSDGLGRFKLGPLEQGEGYVLSASGSGYSYRILENGVVTAQGLMQDVQLIRTGAVSGTVYNPIGQPLEGAIVYFSQEDEPAWGTGEVETDANGEFCICSLDVALTQSPFGSTYNILVVHPDYSYAQGTRVVPPCYTGSDEVVVEAISLQERATIEGTVTVDGVAQAGTKVFLSECLTGLLLQAPIMETDGTGRFIMSVDAPHSYYVTAQGQRTSFLDVQVTVTPGNTATAPNIALEGPGSVVGTVTDLQGSPLSGVIVEILNSLGEGPMADVALSEADGTFSINEVPPISECQIAATLSNSEFYTHFPSVEISVVPGQVSVANLQVDTVPPNCQITSPPSSTSATGVTQIIVQASDNQGLRFITLNIDGEEIGKSIFQSPFPLSWEMIFDWDTTKHLNGSHLLTSHVYDLTGNHSYCNSTVSIQNQILV